MYYWFSAYHGYDWTPRKGFNLYFKDLVLQPFLQWFNLRKDKPGIYLAAKKNLWVNYGRMRGHTVYVRVDNLDIRGVSDGRNYTSPVFQFTLTVAVKTDNPINTFTDFLKSIFKAETAEGQVHLRNVFQQRIHMEFPNDPKYELPLFRILSRQYQFDVSHEYHQLNGSWLCLLPDREHRQGRDSVISGLNNAIDWIMWYETTHGSLNPLKLR